MTINDKEVGVIIAALHYATQWHADLADCCKDIEPDFSDAKAEQKKFDDLRKKIISRRHGRI